ncbi:MAG: glycosyltransferase family 4 protein [Planctomycetaceae bacterium]|nr:glycosyltransferase family 4 protein [Planctomycetaceae bacterium]
MLHRPLEPGTTARPLRILHVIDRLSLGGTQNLLKRSLTELDLRGVSSHVCVLGSERATDPSFKGLSAPDYLEFSGEYRNPWHVRKCKQKLQLVIDRVQPDIVHSYLWVSDFVAALAQQGRSAAHISHIVDRRDWQASQRLVHRLRRRATQWAFHRAGTRFVAVSEAAREFACEHMQYRPESVSVACNGIDWAQFTTESLPDVPRTQLSLGTAGRLENEKGHRHLIDALTDIVKHRSDVRLAITGDGPLRGSLEALVRDRRLTPHVEFLGWVPDVRAFYRSLDVFVVPSVTAEGLPTTILEAMASGCVVIASDVGGAGEAIRDGIDGRLVAPGNPAALVEAISQALDQPELRRTWAASARARVREYFTTERMVDTIYQSYLAALEARRIS